MKKILIVEDDILIAEIERDYLEAEQFDVTICQDGEEGRREGLKKDYDLIILDVMLPGCSGFSICREIRKEKDVAIIMVTAKKEDLDKIRGLGLGADDYIVKPFSPSELVARVKAHINIHERLKGSASRDAKKNEFEQGAIEVAKLKILPLSRQVFVGEEEVELANKEFELLYFLASNPNIVFSKDTLFDRIWGLDALGDTATVAVHINRIREKIGTEEQNSKLIETVWGAGYRFRKN
ncbi:MAG: response regulator transcription factor [Lachnospiraceae bacterium]|nr:response regulator transcription factor [Lachnospiraceae bacterium]